MPAEPRLRETGEVRTMVKTMKYEFVRNRVVLLSLLGVMGGAELFYLVGILSGKNTTISLGLIFLILGAGAVYFTIWLQGLISFGRDLREKTGYMVFLTPVSPYRIVIAKLLVALIELSFTGFFLTLLMTVDLKILYAKYEKPLSIIKTVAGFLGVTPDDLLAAGIVAVVTSLISVLTLYTIAYLCSALSAVFSGGKGGQRGVTILLVVIMVIVYYVISLNLPEIDNNVRNLVVRGFVAKIPRYIFHVLGIAGCTWGTGYLLNNKVSL